MPNAALNNITAPDAYDDAATIDTGGWIVWVNVDVSNQAIYWQIKQARRPNDPPTMSSWLNEVYMPPGSRSLRRRQITGFRIRAATPAGSLPIGAIQAQVTVEAII